MFCRFPQVVGLLRFAPLALVVLCVGCGPDGNRISGMVTFDGKPVPAGKIYFTPDSSKGNSGPTGFADIVNGAYDTNLPGGRGAHSGAMIVAIEGIDPGAAPTSGEASGEDVTATVLFARHEMSLEIAPGDTVQDIEVPLEAAKGPKQPAGATFISP
ncbi:MAG: hypothetical protein EA381_18845 [Planctomycetaceae bacterium]|nr:MAG: hypothetical protein EA381_18845 [Planctomycetaceae bacterium]